ncbi:MAG: DUF3795 domain-containing protein [Desulfatiglans sp.]|jgi:hypothetical protein|nr:DUF3795 domain-containing protein [Thermodesulfobacteriota bacterium]MEE4352073.1 DUF3795 domain-containing protein [Desulfatiglans sp.]
MENRERFDLERVSREEHRLIAPCGIYCGACDLFLGRSREHAKELSRIMKGFNMIDVGPPIMRVEQEKIREFIEILDNWSRGEKCPGCWEGVCWESSGTTACLVRECTKKQGFLTCAECEKMPCHEHHGDEVIESPQAGAWLQIVTKRYSGWNIDNLRRIREIGYRRFIDEMEKKVKSGFLTSDVIGSEMILSEFRKRRKVKLPEGE